MSTSVIDDLVRIYKGATPPDVTATQTGEDIAYAIAEIMRLAEGEVARLGRGSRISTATGIFIDQHLKDHGLRRQSGETDDQAKARLQNPPKAVTVRAIREAVDAVVGAGASSVKELPRWSIFYDRVTFYDRDWHYGGGRGVVIIIIPASANARAAVLDLVRVKIAAGKIYFVLEYT